MVHLVLFMRNRHMTLAQHLAFGRRFGELYIAPGEPYAHRTPALMVIHTDKDSLRNIGSSWRTGDTTTIRLHNEHDHTNTAHNALLPEDFLCGDQPCPRRQRPRVSGADRTPEPKKVREPPGMELDL